MQRLSIRRRGAFRGGALKWWFRRSERGAIAVLVTVLMGGGVLTGMGALAVDIGQLWAEREQLQSGAVSAALGLAKGCGRDPATCGSQAAKAATYANTALRQMITTMVKGPKDGDPPSPQEIGRASCRERV